MVWAHLGYLGVGWYTRRLRTKAPDTLHSDTDNAIGHFDENNDRIGMTVFVRQFQ